MMIRIRRHVLIFKLLEFDRGPFRCWSMKFRIAWELARWQ